MDTPGYLGRAHLEGLTIEALFEKARELSRANRNDDAIVDAYWDHVHALQDHESSLEVAREAMRLSTSKKARDRELGVDVLAQLRGADGDEVLPEIRTALHARLSDTSKDVLASTIHAFGHLGVDDALDEIAAFAKSEHAELRFAVAGALGGLSDELAIATLIELTSDEEGDVRDWACFGLGTQSEQVDTQAVRDALHAHIDDEHPDTRAEAQLGLARRGDPRVFEAVLRELQTEEVADLSIAAAAELADPRFVPALEALRAWWPDPDPIDAALDRCRAGERG